MTMMTEKTRLKVLVTLLAGVAVLAVLSCLLPSQADAQTRGSAGQVRPATGSVWSTSAQGTTETAAHSGSLGAFGEQMVSEGRVEVSLAFPYNVNTRIASLSDAGSGSWASEPPFLTLRGGDGGATMESVDAVRYLPGQGVEVRLTTIWPGGCAAGASEVGAGTTQDGVFFGCCQTCGLDGGVSFGALRRNDGVDNWTPQATWNVDPRPTLDPTKISPYRITWQWLGGGQLSWFVENPDTGRFEPVHLERFANKYITTSMRNSTLPLRAWAGAGSTIRVPSMSLIRQGENNTQGVRWTASNRRNAASGAPVVLLTVRNKSMYQSVQNRVRIAPDFVSVNHAGSSGQDATIRLMLGCTLTPASVWVDTNTANSVTDVDKTSTACANGVEIFSFTAEGSTTTQVPMREYLLRIHPGQTLSVTAQSASGTPSVNAALSWRDEF